VFRELLKKAVRRAVEWSMEEPEVEEREEPPLPPHPLSALFHSMPPIREAEKIEGGAAWCHCGEIVELPHGRKGPPTPDIEIPGLGVPHLVAQVLPCGKCGCLIKVSAE